MKIFYFNIDVGSGIESIGDSILDMIPEEHEVLNYKNQNPPTEILPKIYDFDPDIILMNEAMMRYLVTVGLYKSMRPECRIIIVNHTFNFLKALPLDKENPNKYPNDISNDEIVAINKAVFNTDVIININPYDNSDKLLHEKIVKRKVDKLFFIRDKFEYKRDFRKRKDFFYLGNICNEKFSKSFIKSIEGTDITIDVYGKIFPTKDEEYKNLIKNSKNINYMGYCPEEKIVDVMNNYRFFVSPRARDEPFMTVMAEAITCGCIPLVSQEYKFGNKNWLEHYKDFIVEYNFEAEMLRRMLLYLEIKDDSELVNTLRKTSIKNSKKCKENHDANRFRCLLTSILGNFENKIASA